MRVFLFSTIIGCIVSLFGSFQEVQAQACSVSNITVKLNSAHQVGGTCQINIDLSWDQSNNDGNKYTNLHLWTQAAYPDPALPYSNPPGASALQDALGTVVIKDPDLSTPTLHNIYANAPSTVMLIASSVEKVYVSGSGIDAVYRFTIKGLLIPVSGLCSNPITLKGDIWSSNSNGPNAIQCFTTGASFVTNDPTANGGILCGDPRQFFVNISSPNTILQEATYTVYADLEPFGTLDASDPLIHTSGTITLSTSGYTSTLILNDTYPGKNLWVRVQVPGLSYSTTVMLSDNCLTPLPVALRSFTAQRQSDNIVLLQWETSTEQHNKEFKVQRKNGAGEFQTIASVPSAAKDGNSHTILNYQFQDVNNFTGHSQYRLVQVDLNGRQTMSQVVLVKGSNSGDIAMIVYPNPSPDGNVTLIFNNTGRKDIHLTDGSGRTITLKKGVIASQCRLTGLKTGIYFLKIIQPSAGKSRTEKIIIR